MHFDFTDMRLVIHIAEANSLTAGAERACLSLPAASSRLKRFEESLGLKLFHRTAQGLTLTPAGKVVLQSARDVQQQLDRLCGELHQYTRGVKGTLRLHAETIAMNEDIPLLLPAYLAAHPDIDIEMRERTCEDIVRAISEGAADIGIVSCDAKGRDIQLIPYRHDRLVVVFSPKHALAKLKKIEFVQTLKHEHVSLTEDCAISQLLSQKAAECQASLGVRTRVTNFESACRIVEVNAAIAVMPKSAALRYSQRMQVQHAPLSDPWAQRQLSICVKNIEQLPGFARRLIDLIVGEFAIQAAA